MLGGVLGAVATSTSGDQHGWQVGVIAFCGAFTTYSAVAVQSVNRGGWRGVAYAVGTVLSCLLVAWAGYELG